MQVDRLLVGLLTIVALAGCATRPINEPITRFDPQAGYRPYLLIPKRVNNDPHTLFVLAFSGGGTRAAAFSYGVLEELRRTEIVIDGQRRRLIDEVDIITGVSGGSFTALAPALYGERLFSEYEQRFLKRDVQGTLVLRAVNPFNWWRFIGGSAGRSELAADYYDEILFEGATYADLLTRQAPAVVASDTDISTGSRLAFYQNDFDLLCSDLNKVRLSRAAATYSAVPVVLSTVTFNNYGGTRGYQYPAWVADVTKTEGRVRPSARSAPRTDWDRHEAPPGTVAQLLAASGVPIDRYSFETIETMKDRQEIYGWRREILIARERLAGATEAEAEARVSLRLPELTTHVMDVSFDEVEDPAERDHLMNLPTSFVLPAEDVDRLREVAGRQLRRSPDFQALVRELGGNVRQ